MQLRFRIASLLCAAIVAVAMPLAAQNNTSSPFSRFGYGEVNDNATGSSRGMGGLSIGLRQHNAINTVNPASYSAVDSMTFMMDVGASGFWTLMRDASGSRTRFNGNLEYLTLQVPIWKYFGLSLGFLPYSSVGYNFALTNKVTPSLSDTVTYEGEGGFSQVYGGFSAKLFNWVALGVNVYYMWGEVENSRSLEFVQTAPSPLYEVSSLHVSDVRLRYGAQLFHTFGDHSFVAGGILEWKSKLNGDFLKMETLTLDTVMQGSDGFDLPLVWGAGLTYTYADRLTVGVDYLTQDWSKARYFGVTDSLRSRQKWTVGAQYIHNPLGTRYYERMVWRVGAHMSDSYVKTVTTKDWGVTIGVGFPLRNAATTINTSFEYGHRGGKELVRENYFKFTLSTTISETWFFKRRL